MPITLYRGDTRTPADIKTAGGFSAWAPLSQAQAQALVLRCLGQPYDQTLLQPLPAPADFTPLQQAIDSNQPFNLLTLMAEIKKGKSHDTVHISTDVSEAAGGYASSYVYQMPMTLNYQKNGRGAVQPVDSPASIASRVGTNLVFDGASMAASQLIALTGVGAVGLTEVSFLTSIPYASITQYKEPGGSVWIAMP